MTQSTTHYVSDSRGPIEIASMSPAHAENALAKLRREQHLGERRPRQDEIDALEAHVAAMAEVEAEGRVNG